MTESTPTSPPSLETYRITSAPASMYYIPDFISAQEEEDILHNIPPNKWIALHHRRLQTHPSALSKTNALLTTKDTALPSWLLDPIVPRITATSAFDDSPHGINHCLVNEYLPGQGILAHEDGPAYWDGVATVSLQGGCVLDVTAKTSRESGDQEAGDDKGIEKPASTIRIFQSPRSLLITTAAAYTTTLHGISETEIDEDLSARTVANWDLLPWAVREEIEANDGRMRRETRISLTFRDVLKVVDVGGKVFGRTRGR